MPTRSGLSANSQYLSGGILKSCRYQVMPNSVINPDTMFVIPFLAAASPRLANASPGFTVLSECRYQLGWSRIISLFGMVVSGSIQRENPKPAAFRASPKGLMPLG